ncbi:hypothetical protein Tcan_06865 [Toxocara canis]|uniref:Uncharacterized protein n=1 Tax=Toxocara canis TaxID=6265 RepID=A0A0B2V7E5_TOXCA|nr:hypothetical protein Tcan_06865 [Toxocara canis]
MLVTKGDNGDTTSRSSPDCHTQSNHESPNQFYMPFITCTRYETYVSVVIALDGITRVTILDECNELNCIGQCIKVFDEYEGHRMECSPTE